MQMTEIAEQVEESIESDAEVSSELSQTPQNYSIPDDSNEEIVQGRCKPSWKPDIDHLQDAVDRTTGILNVKVGDKILIQYPAMWRDTTIYIVKSINPSHVNELGFVGLWDPNKMQFTCTNYITGPARGLVFKIPDNSRRWIPGEDDDLMTRVKRKYRRHNVSEKPVKEDKVVTPAPVDENGNPVKRKRGRPKGSKNKSTLEREAAERAKNNAT